MANVIPISVKKKCLELRTRMTTREVYETYYKTLYPDTLFETFSRSLRKWRKKIVIDEKVLEGGNLCYNYIPNATTVQVNSNGEVIQAWIKSKDENQWQKQLIEAIKTHTEPIKLPCENNLDVNCGNMLEIPLTDVHFGINTLEDYAEKLNKLEKIIKSKVYHTIVLVIGQDLLHSNNITESKTVKGTILETVDTQTAWKSAQTFYSSLIEWCYRQSLKLKVIYSKGNHDADSSWFFVQWLKCRYPQIDYDDSFEPRKIIHWNKVFVGISHAEYQKSKPTDLFSQFATEFANSTVRELHLGHKHFESSVDIGIVVRRLPTATKTDEWSKNNGFVTARKNFQVFEYTPNSLYAIYYI